MTRSATVAGLAIAMMATWLPAQSSSSPSPAFEVVSIKPNPVPAGARLIRALNQKPSTHAEGNRFYQKQTTLQDLVMMAYGVWDYQISGLPDWAKAPNGDHFEVDARATGETTPPVDQLPLMVQSLLADRFQLRLHRDMKELPVYLLTVGRNGAKLSEIPGEPRRGTTIQSLVNLLSNVVDRPILDKTGLTGSYDLAPVSALNWGQLGAEHRADPMSIPESLTGTLEDKLGLKLEPRKEPIEVLVIDHAEKPSPN